jgi:hypothetical protein
MTDATVNYSINNQYGFGADTGINSQVNFLNNFYADQSSSNTNS